MNIQIRTCSDSELPSIEQSLMAQGYYPVAKTNEKDLHPGEYMKSSYSGSVESFDGQRMWTVRICTQ